EALEDGGAPAPDDPSPEDDESPRNLGLREQPGGVDAARGVEPGNRRPDRKGAGRDDRALEVDAFALLDRDRVRTLEAAEALRPGDAVRLEQRRHPARHLLDDGGLPFVRGGEVEPRLRCYHPELRVDLTRGVQL